MGASILFAGKIQVKDEKRKKVSVSEPGFIGFQDYQDLPAARQEDSTNHQSPLTTAPITNHPSTTHLT